MTVCSKSMSTRSLTIFPLFSILSWPGLGQYGAQGGGGTLTGAATEATGSGLDGVGDFCWKILKYCHI